MPTGLIIYGPDGEKRRASPAEQAEFDAAIARQQAEALEKAFKASDERKYAKELKKELRAKGLQPNKTRSVFGWRMRERRGSAVKFSSYTEREDKYGEPIPPTADWRDWDYAAPGEGTLWKEVPRLNYAELEVFDLFAVRRDAKGKKRKRCVEKGFKHNCGDASCGKETCAICWGVNFATIKENETIVVKRRDGPKPRVIDSSGVHPKGARAEKAKDMGDDQRAPYNLTSSLYQLKTDASDLGRDVKLDRDPADAKMPQAVVPKRG